MTIHVERIVANIDEEVDETLKIIKEMILDKVEKVDDEDGGYFWVKKEFIPGRTIDECENLLNGCARVYRLSRIKNTNPKYRKYSQLVAHIRMDFLPKSLTEMLEELEVHESKEDIRPTTS